MKQHDGWTRGPRNSGLFRSGDWPLFSSLFFFRRWHVEAAGPPVASRPTGNRRPTPNDLSRVFLFFLAQREWSNKAKPAGRTDNGPEIASTMARGRRLKGRIGPPPSLSFFFLFPPFLAEREMFRPNGRGCSVDGDSAWGRPSEEQPLSSFPSLYSVSMIVETRERHDRSKTSSTAQNQPDDGDPASLFFFPPLSPSLCRGEVLSSGLPLVGGAKRGRGGGLPRAVASSFFFIFFVARVRSAKGQKKPMHSVAALGPPQRTEGGWGVFFLSLFFFLMRK